MFEKIKNSKKYQFLQQFRDSRAIGLAAFGIVAILVTWSTVKAVQTNYELQKQISQLQQQNDVKKLDNDNLALRNKYLETDQFLELAARRQFGLAAPGENVYLVPKSVALSHATSLTATVTSTKQTPQRPAYQKHFQAWINFFLHRQSTTN